MRRLLVSKSILNVLPFRGVSSSSSSSTLHADWFKKVLGAQYAITHEEDPELLCHHSTDWIGRWPPSEGQESWILLRPANTKEVAQVVKYCHDHRISIVPQGGNTGLVGGSTPVNGSKEVILSLSRLNRILSIDTQEGIIECEAGCTLQTLSDVVSAHGFEMPLDLGAKGSCQIGGNLSTNAGGVRFVRHGPLRGHVMKLQVVDGCGDAVTLGSLMRKDNTGIDMKQLFIGAEGLLGIITSVALHLPRAPVARQVALFKVDSFASAIDVVKLSKEVAGEALSAIEFMDNASMRHVLHHFQTSLNPPFLEMHDKASYEAGYVLVEVAGSNADHDSGKLMQLSDTALVAGFASDAVIPASFAQINSLWQMREYCASALTGAGYICYKYDLSLPLSKFNLAMDATRQRLQQYGFSSSPTASLLYNDDDGRNVLKSSAELVCWGHLGDGNIHLNVISRSVDPQLEACLEPWLFDWVIEQGGSVSAEHGVGRCKRELLMKVHSPEVLSMMRKLKAVFDPKGILNPHKMLP